MPTKKKPEDTITASTIAEATHEPANRPDSFKALKLPELVEAANAFGTETEGNEEVLRADLAANGVSWNMYAKAFKLPGWAELPDEEESEPVLVDDWEEAEEVKPQPIITRSPIEDLADGKYLIKFVGDNWYFERGKYAFSKDSPYALMPAHEAQNALVQEPTKFRQAFPDELKDFYDRK